MSSQFTAARDSALYFPYIHVQDPKWLKWSLLLWDSIYRISPGGYPRPSRNAEIQEIENQTNLVRTISPGFFASRIERRFVDFVNNNLDDLKRFAVLPGGLNIASLGFGRQRESMWRQGRLQSQIRIQGESDDAIQFIHFEKIGGRFIDLIESTGLGILAEDDDNNWITWVGVHPKIASLYMMALTNEIAAQNHLNPVTDTGPHLTAMGEDFDTAAKYILSDSSAVNRIFQRPSVYGESLMLTLKVFAPKDIESIPLDHILEFRQKYLGELLGFQKYVREKAENLQSNFDNNLPADAACDWIKDELEKDLRLKLHELEEVYRDLGHEIIPTAINMKFTSPQILSSLTAGGSLLFGGSPVIAGGAGFALSLIPAIKSAQKNLQTHKKSNPASFLYSLNRLEKFTKGKILGQLKYSTRAFVFGS